MRKSDKLKNIEEANKRLLGENTINEVGGNLTVGKDFKIPTQIDGPSNVFVKLNLDVPSPHIAINLEDWSYELSDKAKQVFESMDEEKRGEILKQAGQQIINSLIQTMASCVDGVCDNN
jgi:hypothetical protein